MTKADAVTAGLQAIQAGEQQVLSDQLGAAFDAGAGSVAAGGFTQAQVDAAVKAATDPLNAQIASVQAALAAETAQDQTDAAARAALQQKLDQIKALIGA